MSANSEAKAPWRGPVVFTQGFRPFFLGAASWAVLCMGLWVAMLAGLATIPTAFDPISWHAHEMLFGYLGAVLPGFILTAAPNWTNRPGLAGWPIVILFGLWLAGRAAIAYSAALPPLAVAIIDLSSLILLSAYLLREIAASKNWRNLVLFALLSCLVVANGLFHWEAVRDGYAAGGFGFRLGLAAAVMMIVVVGSRVTPAFTRNWLAKTGRAARPAAFDVFGKAAVLAMVLGLAAWVSAPAWRGAGAMLTVAGALLAIQLLRWRGVAAWSEPLVWILHVGFGFMPVGAIVLGLSILFPGYLEGAAAQHLLMAGGVGVMTLAVMTRATLGHSGRTLTAGKGTLIIYLMVIGAVAARFCAGMAPEYASDILTVSGALWCIGFSGFIILYAPMCVRNSSS